MKKKKVVALLLAAAMTTASFMPSTGFFNITEVQAYKAQSEVTSVTGVQSPVLSFQSFETEFAGKYISSGAYEVLDENVVVSPAAASSVKANKILTQTNPKMNKDGIVEAELGDVVTFTAIVLGTDYTTTASASALAETMGSIFGVAAVDSTWSVTTAAITSCTRVGHNVAFAKGTDGKVVSYPAIAGNVTVSKPGLHYVGFVSGGATAVSFGGVQIKAYTTMKKSKTRIAVSNGGVQFVTNSGMEVTGQSIEFDEERIDTEYVSGAGFKYEWYYKNDDGTAAKLVDKKAEKDADLSTFKLISTNEKLSAAESVSAGSYAVAISFGDDAAVTSSQVFAYHKKAATEKEVSSSALVVGEIAKNSSGTALEVDANVVDTYTDNTITTRAAAEAKLAYKWCVVSKSEIEGVKFAFAPAFSDKVVSTASSLAIKDEYAGKYAVVFVSAEGITEGAVRTFGAIEVAKSGGKTDDKNTETISTSPAAMITPGTITTSDDGNTLTVTNAHYLDKNKVKTTVSTSGLTYDWYLINKELFDKLPNTSNATSAGAITSGAVGVLKQVQSSTSASLTLTATDFATAQYVAVVIRDAEYKDIEIAFLKKSGVKYTAPSKSNTNNTSRNNRNSSSSSGGSSNSGSTGTNSTNNSGTNTTNNSSSSSSSTPTSTTTPTGTTPATNVVDNADGSKTTTTSETKADGSKVETSKTEYPDGSSLEKTTETKADGTTVETTVEKAANGDVATTTYTVSPNGSKSKKVSIVKADGTSETVTITENTDGSATIVNETKDASGSTSIAYSLAAGAAGVTVDKIDTTAKKVVIPAQIAIAGGAATLKGVTSLRANSLSLEGKTIKVTKVGAAALKGNKTATNLVIGKNIKTIGKQAFMNATKVKTVNFKGNVNTIGKNSFKNINKKATIKIKATAKQFKALKKKIKNKGAAPAKVTYKRVK